MAVIWGVNFSVVKYGTQQLEPLAFNGVRVLIATAVLTGLAVARSAPWPARRDVWRLLLLGLLGNGLYQILFIEGIARSRAGTAALVLASTPALIAIIGRLRGTEHLRPRGWVGIALQLVGVGSVVLMGTSAVAGAASGTSAPGDTLVGSALILAGALCWAVFTVLLKPVTHRLGAVHIGALTMAGGAVPLLAFASPAMMRTQWDAVPANAVLALAYSAIGALVVAYLLWYRGVRMLGPTRTAMYANLQPLIALLVAWILLNEAPTAWQAGGAACIMTGLLVSRS